MAQFKNDKILKKIAAQLKLLRESEDLTLQDVYNDTDIHIGRIESTEANISVSTLSKLCEYYKISLSDFFKLVES